MSKYLSSRYKYGNVEKENPLVRLARKKHKYNKETKKGNEEIMDKTDRLISEAMKKAKTDTFDDVAESDKKDGEVEERLSSIEEKLNQLESIIIEAIGMEEGEEEEPEEEDENEPVLEEEIVEGKKKEEEETEKANYPSKPQKPKLLSEKEQLRQKVETGTTVPEQSKVTSETSKAKVKSNPQSFNKGVDYFVGSEPKADGVAFTGDIQKDGDVMVQIIKETLQGKRYRMADLMKMVR